jgi:hypothetical protein
VTVRRVSTSAATSAKGVPQARQNRARAGFSSPQFGQATMLRVYDAAREIL